MTALRQPERKPVVKVPLLHVAANLRGFYLSGLEFRTEWTTDKAQSLLLRAEELGFEIVNGREVRVSIPEGEPVGLVSEGEIMAKLIDDLDAIGLEPMYRLARLWSHVADSPLFDWSVAALTHITEAHVDESSDISIKWCVIGTSNVAKLARYANELGAELPFRMNGDAKDPGGVWREKIDRETLAWIRNYDPDSPDSGVDVLFPHCIDWTAVQNGWTKGEYYEEVTAVSIDEVCRLWREGRLKLEAQPNDSPRMKQFLQMGSAGIEQKVFIGMEGVMSDPFGALAGK